MSYVRLNKHYLHLPSVILGLFEFCLLALAGFIAANVSDQSADIGSGYAAFIYALVLSACSLSMGVYPAMVKEGFSSMALRTVVSFFLLGSAALMLLGWVFTAFYSNHLLLLLVIFSSTLLVLPARLLFKRLVDTQQMRRKIMVFGCGQKSAELLRDIELHANGRIEVGGCVPCSDSQPVVEAKLVYAQPKNWLEFAKLHNVSEIVIAPDERRKSDGAFLPLDQFLDCKLAGVAVTDGQSFCERELGRIDLMLLSPSWMLFSDGFDYSVRRYWAKRIFDISLSLLFLAVLWPFMLLTALAVALESGMPMLLSLIHI